MSADLSKIVNESGTYVIPVEWTVASTVTVEADNLQQAIDTAKELLKDIPLDVDPEYVADSYRIAIDDDEDAIAAQSYSSSSGVAIDRDKHIMSNLI